MPSCFAYTPAKPANNGSEGRFLFQYFLGELLRVLLRLFQPLRQKCQGYCSGFARWMAGFAGKRRSSDFNKATIVSGLEDKNHYL